MCIRDRGYSVTIFDSRDKIGGVLQYGIPEFRLPKSILDRYKKKLLSIGIKIRPNTTIGGALEIKDLFRDGYKSIFIGTGVWRPKTLGVKGCLLYTSGPTNWAMSTPEMMVTPGVTMMSRRVSLDTILPSSAATMVATWAAP